MYVSCHNMIHNTGHIIYLLTCNLRCKWAAMNVLVVKFDNDIIVSRSCWQVGHSAGSIFVVLTGDLSLRRTFHCQ